MPELISKYGLTLQQLQLIKVDTDGFDYDCIMSMGDMLQTVSPLLYWEHFLENNEQHNAYSSMLSYLEEMGYVLFVVFDNVGHMLFTLDVLRLKQFHEYLLAVILDETTTYYNHDYYFDILACKADKVDFVHKIMKDYEDLYADSLKKS
ncbi:hypothetical protein AGMMS50276_29310 [Synergistales bacterium]|nr:hypothetical protein AGMMS50276_29310 [Synergistales bacterium]